MAVKYECPKCGRRYVEWGAEKVNFQCPHCSGAEVVKLLRLGSREEVELAAASLKRRAKKEVIVAPVDDDIDDVVDDEEAEVEEIEVGTGVGLVDPALEDSADVVIDDEDADEVGDEEAPEDLDFGADKADFDEGPVRDFDE
jgi:DNA-directed RNA polymerase subunit RPC12/RpoP